MDTAEIKTMSCRVAETAFSLALPESDPLWPELEKAYGPFETDRASDPEGCGPEQPLMQVRLRPSLPFCKDRPVYLEQERKHGFPALNVYDAGSGALWVEILPPDGSEAEALMLLREDCPEVDVCVRGDAWKRLHGLTCAVMMAFAMKTARSGMLLLHATAVLHAGRAFVFLGPSRTGKSTHARLWLRHVPDTLLLNDDHPVLRIGPDGKAIIYGSPWSGYHPCYKNLWAPAGGFIRLKQAQKNSIRPLSGLEAYASLYPSSSGMSWIRAFSDAKSRTVEQAVRSCGNWELSCLPDAEAALLCRDQACGG